MYRIIAAKACFVPKNNRQPAVSVIVLYIYFDKFIERSLVKLKSLKHEGIPFLNVQVITMIDVFKIIVRWKSCIFKIEIKAPK